MRFCILLYKVQVEYESFGSCNVEGRFYLPKRRSLAVGFLSTPPLALVERQIPYRVVRCSSEV